MIVCNCNALNERKVEDAANAGAKTWLDVHHFHGCVPDCGSCEEDITQQIQSKKLGNLPNRRTPPASQGFLTAAE